MRHAYMIMAHNQFELLELLVKCLDWTRGDPYVFRDGDYDELIGSDYLFARKFDIRSDRAVCERVAEHALADAEREG